jgi:hypothetical protein
VQRAVEQKFPRDVRPTPQQRFDPVRGHRQFHPLVRAIIGVGSGQDPERAVRTFRPNSASKRIPLRLVLQGLESN